MNSNNIQLKNNNNKLNADKWNFNSNIYDGIKFMLLN